MFANVPRGQDPYFSWDAVRTGGSVADPHPFNGTPELLLGDLQVLAPLPIAVV